MRQEQQQQTIILIKINQLRMHLSHSDVGKLLPDMQIHFTAATVSVVFAIDCIA